MIDFIYPNICPVCKIFVDSPFCLCAHCWSKVHFIPPSLEENMNDIDESILDGKEISTTSRLSQLRSVAVYCGISRVLIRLLKYHDKIDLALMMAQWMFRIGKDLVLDSDIIVAIPLHRFRLMSRKYNQSAEIARLIAIYGKKPFLSGILVRSRFTRQQVELSLSARKKNLQNAFIVPQDAQKHIKGLKILLIDDVYTTGATAHSAMNALKKAGAASVSILTFSRSYKSLSHSLIKGTNLP
ncbi:ComF family protein [Candidatus Liberibacter sp.]|uniref:ComF family protein n=1 Tax=Candidatus Liberibacter sp. TaxID=34022 RepID=UPI0021753D3F|nr:ComF family protein [Candidatus Liberibacter sp.]